MTVTRKALPMVAIFAVVAAFGMVPFGARAADHLDAPGLTSPALDTNPGFHPLLAREAEVALAGLGS